jgi:hypothetical protein
MGRFEFSGMILAIDRALNCAQAFSGSPANPSMITAATPTSISACRTEP